MIANVHEAKSQLSKLLDAANRGEEVFITRRGERFMIVQAPPVDRSRLFGALKDQFTGDIDYKEADSAFAEIMDEYMDKIEREE